jgi:hypothetical protein
MRLLLGASQFCFLAEPLSLFGMPNVQGELRRQVARLLRQQEA